MYSYTYELQVIRREVADMMAGDYEYLFCRSGDPGDTEHRDCPEMGPSPRFWRQAQALGAALGLSSAACGLDCLSSPARSMQLFITPSSDRYHSVFAVSCLDPAFPLFKIEI